MPSYQTRSSFLFFSLLDQSVSLLAAVKTTGSLSGRPGPLWHLWVFYLIGLFDLCTQHEASEQLISEVFTVILSTRGLPHNDLPLKSTDRMDTYTSFPSISLTLTAHFVTVLTLQPIRRLIKPLPSHFFHSSWVTRSSQVCEVGVLALTQASASRLPGSGVYQPICHFSFSDTTFSPYSTHLDWTKVVEA